jgi:hypothetical protein
LSSYSLTQFTSLLLLNSNRSQYNSTRVKVFGGIRCWHCSSKALATRQNFLYSIVLRW